MLSNRFFLLSPLSRLGVSALRCSSIGFTVFQQFSFFVGRPKRGHYVQISLHTNGFSHRLIVK